VNELEEKKKVRKLPVLASITLSFGIILVILKFTIKPETLEYLSAGQLRYEFFIAAVIFNIIYWCIWGIRLKVLSSAIDKTVDISYFESIKIIISNLFLASITPSSAGGEPVRIHLLHKKGMSMGGATATVISERLFDAIFILICVPFAFFVFKDIIDVDVIKIGLYVGITLFIAVISIFFYAIKNPEKLKSFLIFLARKTHKIFPIKTRKHETHIIERIVTEVDNFHQSMTYFRKENKKGFFLAGVLTVLFWSSGFLIPSLILMGLGLNPFFIESYSAQVLLIIIVLMPTTPGSSGIAEASGAILYAPLISQSLLGIFILLFRLVTYYMGLLVGAIFLYKIFK
jgi:uncharacterized protein (TIRG00374 family)